MGYDLRRYTVLGRVSRHNSEQDKLDDEAWDNLKMEIKALIKSDPNYSRVSHGGIES